MNKTQDAKVKLRGTSVVRNLGNICIKHFQLFS